MVTVADHYKKLAAPYRRASRSTEVISSAKNLAKLILGSDEIILPHKKRILSEVLWFLSEADGKYSTRFRSKEVVRLAMEDPTSDVRIQHEHVYPRASVTAKLLDNIDYYRANPEALNLLLDETVGCVVTESEHINLLSGSGWKRYAKVPVFDMSLSPPQLVVTE
jgi:hypothetical protein